MLQPSAVGAGFKPRGVATIAPTVAQSSRSNARDMSMRDTAMSAFDFDPDEWESVRHGNLYQNIQTGKVIHKETFENRMETKKMLRNEDVTPNEKLRELIAEWRERGVEDPYGMTWLPPADELEAVINE